jgi:DNA-binding NarL/FixJ family response regulator
LADSGRALSVLVVEDSATDTKLLIHALRTSGLRPEWERVETASQLEEALRRRGWDAVLSDSGLPGFGARAALELTKKLAPGVPFFVVSGAIQRETADDLRRLGAVDCIGKESLERLAPAILVKMAAPNASARTSPGEKLRTKRAHEAPRVLVATAPLLSCAGLAALVTRMGAEVVGQAQSGIDALRLIRSQKPDVALVAMDLHGTDGLEVTRRVAKDARGTRVLIIGSYASAELVREAFAAGASGWLARDADEAELERAVRAVARGEVWLNPDRSLGEMQPSLTPRQREVLQLIVDGLSTSAIALRLHISVKTVETHRTALMARLDIHNVAGLVHYAISSGIIHRHT